MNTQDIYNLAIEVGIKNDFRTKAQIDSILKRAKDKYAKLSKDEKELFDTERIKNPYLDSRIHFKGGSKVIKKSYGWYRY